MLSRSLTRRSSCSTDARRDRNSSSAFSRSFITSSLPDTTALLRDVSTSRSASEMMRRAVSSAEVFVVACRSISANRPAPAPSLRPKKKKAGEATMSTPSAANNAISFIASMLHRSAAAEERIPPPHPRSAAR